MKNILEGVVVFINKFSLQLCIKQLADFYIKTLKSFSESSNIIFV